MLSDTKIVSTGSLAMYDVVCDSGFGSDGEEFVMELHVILPRRGVFVRRAEGRTITADSHSALVCLPGETQEIDHPTDRGDRSTVFSFGETWREAAPLSTGDHVVSSAVWREHRSLVDNRFAPIQPLELEEAALVILDLMAASTKPHTKTSKRMTTRARHDDLASECRALLASSPCDAWTLDMLGREIGSSPYHLARVFRSVTGTSIHAYLTRLRISEVADRLADGADDITSLALEFGFADHAHLTRTFRQFTGTTPSRYRRGTEPSCSPRNAQGGRSHI